MRRVLLIAAMIPALSACSDKGLEACEAKIRGSLADPASYKKESVNSFGRSTRYHTIRYSAATASGMSYSGTQECTVHPSGDVEIKEAG